MTIQEIKEKLEIGDYILASKMLKITPENVRTRFIRNKEDVKEILILIVNNRGKLIRKFHESKDL
ncbi:hypothetical protein [uncultured Apibacter sp.]|uniref:hypothetical protein n=1 Tax=uncultured Apibacter sp. TaxID=1778616 RepID=UPI002600B9B8|nr:hypothetical protein [uncultured Apibacter sp.]